jgi:hypothetical protein
MAYCCCPCRALPHGWYAVLVAILATIAWLSSLFQDGCNFAVVTGPIVAQLHPTFTSETIPFLQFGLSAFQEPNLDEFGNYTLSLIGGNCTEYPEEQLVDTMWTTSRSFAFLALVLGGGCSVFVWCSTCFVFSRVTWRWTGYALLLASMCQGAVYVWFSTQLCSWNTCTLSYGAKSDIAAVALWMVSGMLIVLRYPPPTRQLIASDEEEFEQKQQKDGIMMTKQQQQHCRSSLQEMDAGDEPDVTIDDGTALSQQGSGESTTEVV